MVGSASSPLISEPEGYLTPEQRVNKRLRLVRLGICIFVSCLVVGVVVTAVRLATANASQDQIDTTFPPCRKGYVLGLREGAGRARPELILWSGKSERNCNKNELCDDLWTFDVNASGTNQTAGAGGRWRRVPARRDTVRPEPRWKATSVQDDAGNLYVFAGDPLRPDGSYISDVWKLDAKTLAWEQLQPACDADSVPAGSSATCDALQRRAHAAAIMNNTMYVHGGKDPASDLINDIWSLDLTSLRWTLLWEDETGKNSKGAPHVPAARKGHTLVAYPTLHRNATGKRERALVLFGGRVDIQQYFNDVWAFFPDHGAWEPLVPERLGAVRAPGALQPHPRDHHAAAVVGTGMYSYGGWFEMRHAFDDMWRFDLESYTWTVVQVATAAPAPQARFLVSLQPVGATWLYLVGGELGADEAPRRVYLNDVWAFDTASDTWTLVAPSRCPRDHSVRRLKRTGGRTG